MKTFDSTDDPLSAPREGVACSTIVVWLVVIATALLVVLTLSGCRHAPFGPVFPVAPFSGDDGAPR